MNASVLSTQTRSVVDRAQAVSAAHREVYFECAEAVVGFVSDNCAVGDYVRTALADYIVSGVRSSGALFCRIVYISDLQLAQSVVELFKPDLARTEYVAGQQTFVLQVDASQGMEYYQPVMISPASRTLVWLRHSGTARHESQAMLRAVRGALAAGLRSIGYHVLHASSIGVGDKALAIVGNKMAGKTTTLISSLRFAGCDMISNDSLFLRMGVDGIDVRSLPFAAGVRKNTLELFDVFAPVVADPATYHCDNPAKERGGTIADRVYIPPKALADLCGRTFRTQGVLCGVVFPELHNQLTKPSFLTMTEHDAASAIDVHWVDLPLDDQPFWANIEPSVRANRAVASALARLISKNLPVLRLSQAPSANHQSAQMLRALIEGSSSSGK